MNPSHNILLLETIGNIFEDNFINKFFSIGIFLLATHKFIVQRLAMNVKY